MASRIRFVALKIRPVPRGHRSVNLDAGGKVRKIMVTSEGAGNIDLEKLDVEDATVRMDGVGNVTIGATNLVDVTINGAGHLTLTRKPKTLRSSLPRGPLDVRTTMPYTLPTASLSRITCPDGVSEVSCFLRVFRWCTSICVFTLKRRLGAVF